MRLILVRHGEAAPIGMGGIRSDEERTLTETGLHDAQVLGGVLQAAGVQPQAIFTSPLVRAVQTAEGLASKWNLPPTVTHLLKVDRLSPDDFTQFVAETGHEVVVAVGHNPDISRYACWLVGGGSFPFAPAAAASIAFRGPPAAATGWLEWFLSPDVYNPNRSRA
jgi:phosphohistidine phosphatase SixA